MRFGETNYLLQIGLVRIMYFIYEIHNILSITIMLVSKTNL